MMIRGKDIDIYVRQDDEWWNVACAVSGTISHEADAIAITTIDSGRDRQYIGGARDGRIELSGVMTLDQTTKWQFDNFLDETGNLHRFLFTIADSNGLSIAYDMYGIITSVSGRGEATDFGLFDVSILRSGPMTKLNENEEGNLVDSDGIEILDSDGNPITTG
jgi:predicted secreted protein